MTGGGRSERHCANYPGRADGASEGTVQTGRRRHSQQTRHSAPGLRHRAPLTNDEDGPSFQKPVEFSTSQVESYNAAVLEQAKEAEQLEEKRQDRSVSYEGKRLPPPPQREIVKTEFTNNAQTLGRTLIDSARYLRQSPESASLVSDLLGSLRFLPGVADLRKLNRAQFDNARSFGQAAQPQRGPPPPPPPKDEYQPPPPVAPGKFGDSGFQ